MRYADTTEFNKNWLMHFCRTSPAEFIIPFNQYMRSAEIDYSVGTRFKMAFEGEECAEQRCGPSPFYPLALTFTNTFILILAIAHGMK